MTSRGYSMTCRHRGHNARVTQIACRHITHSSYVITFSSDPVTLTPSASERAGLTPPAQAATGIVLPAAGLLPDPAARFRPGSLLSVVAWS